MKHTQPILDRFAIATSTLCVLHCVALPFATSFFPAALSTLFDDHIFHQLLVLGVIPSSVVALLMGCRQHKDKTVLTLGVIGVLLLLLIALFGHEMLGELGEKAGTVISSLLIVAAHVRNHLLCQEYSCTHEEDNCSH